MTAALQPINRGMEGHTLAELADLWIISRSYAPESARQRRHFLDHLAAHVGDRTPDQITPAELIHWWASTDTWSPETRRAAHSSIRGFLRWCQAVGVAAPQTLEEIRRPRVPRRPPRVLTPAEEAALRARVAGGPDELAVALMLDLGLRRSEVVRVTVEDIDGGWLTVRGKGGHVDRLPFPAHVAPLVPETGRLVPLSAGHMATRVVAVMRAAGIRGRTCHALRRTFATRLMHSGTPAVDVMRWLRHTSLATTTYYVASSLDPAA